MEDNMIIVNSRTTDGRGMTGIKRYTDEIFSRLSNAKKLDVPAGLGSGIRGRLWEQMILPTRINGLLWSPANIGPLHYKYQVLTIHDLSPIDHPEWFNSRYALMNRLIQPSLARRVRHVITVSDFSRSRIIDEFNIHPSKVSVIPLAADPRFMPLSSQAIAESKQNNLWPEKYVLSVGNLEPRKNLLRLFEAWESWDTRPTGMKLLVAGAGDSAFSGSGFSRVPKDVQLLGKVQDKLLPQLYACADLFIYPSLYEGFGLPPLEAMACRIPVITSDITSIPEVVGDSAICVDPYNVNELMIAMKRVTDNMDLALEMAQRGEIRSKSFSWKATSESTQQILNAEINR